MSKPDRRRLTVLWVLAALAATAMGAQNEPVEPVPAPAVLEIIEQSPSVAAGESFVVRVRAFGLDPAAITVDVAVFPAAVAPEPLLEPGEQDPILASEDAAAAEVLVSGNGELTVRIPVGAEAGGGELALPAPGVYPIRLSLIDGAGTTATATTTLLHRPTTDEGATPTPVGLVLEAGEGALSVEELIAMLTAHEDLAATIVLHRDAVALLERDGDAVDGFRQALAGRTVVVGTPVPLDPAALVVGDQEEVYLRGVARMRERMAALDIPVETRAVIIETPLTPAAADLLTGHGIATAIGTGLAGVGAGEPWPVTSGRVDGGSGPLFVLGTDVGDLTAVAAGGDTPLAQTHGLLARLALGDGSTPVVGALDRLIDPGELLVDLTDEPQASMWTMLPVTDARYQRQASESVVALRAAPVQDLGPSAAALARIEDLLVRYEGFHADGPRSPDHYRNVLMEAFRIDVGPGTRADTLGRIEGELVRAFEQIDLPGNQSVTLAAQAAPLPVAVDNGADGARYVRVQVTSDKISMAEPDLVLRVEQGMSAVDVPVRTRSLGASPLTVTLLTPDGAQVLSTTRFQVRSTAVPGLGLLISAVGLGALAAWWYLSARRSGGDDGGGGSSDDDDPDGDGPRTGSSRRHRPVADGDPIDLRPAGRPLSAVSAKSRLRVGDSV
ncbi:MAG: DUF6049 family protein [Actinomycetota bacterium]